MDADVNQQLGDILSADPFSFLQFRRWLESKTSDWLLTFWLDAEFYKGIRKQKAKTAFAKQVYGKYVVPPTYRFAYVLYSLNSYVCSLSFLFAFRVRQTTSLLTESYISDCCLFTNLTIVG